jgi:hypothetical protein
MLATLKLDTPKDLTFAKLKFDRKLLGQAFKKDQRVVSGALESLTLNWDDFEPIATALEAKGEAEVDVFKVTT